MRLVISGDWHLARRAWASLPAVQGDAYRSAQQIFHYCAESNDDGPTALILAGDVFDTVSPPPDAVECFLRGVDKMQELGIPVYAIQGQHGRYDELPWPSIHPHVINLSTQEPVAIWPGQPFRIAGFDTTSPDVLPSKLEVVPKDVAMLIMHQMLRGTVPDLEGRQTWDFDPEWVPGHVKHVFLGDYHKAVTLKSSRGTEFVYTGAINMQSVDEEPEKSFVVYEFKTRAWRRVPLSTRPFVSYTCYHAENIGKLLESLSELDPETLVLLKYDPRVPDVEKLAREANDSVHYIFRVVPVQDVVEGAASLESLKDVSLAGCLDQLVNREEDPEFHSFVLSLLKSTEHKGTIAALRAKYVEETSVEEKQVETSVKS